MAAAAFAPKISPVLVAPPDPHCLPGSTAGHCPCWHKHALAQTYGGLTAQLLTSPKGALPGQRRELQPNCCLPGSKEPGWNERSGARPPSARAIPGYTGFIPRAQNHFAKSYSEVCREARNEFAQQQAREAGKKQARQATGGSPHPRKTPSQGLRSPLAAASRDAAPYWSRWAFQPQGSPYSLQEGHPQKHFMPGFTGFVPRARYLFGATYPTVTRRALEEFDRMRLRRQRQAALGGRPETEEGGGAACVLRNSRPTEGGLLPH